MYPIIEQDDSLNDFFFLFFLDYSNKKYPKLSQFNITFFKYGGPPGALAGLKKYTAFICITSPEFCHFDVHLIGFRIH